jgi:desampylase
MIVRISSKLHQQLLSRAAASPDVEICGLLIGDGAVERIIPTANTATDPSRRFEIDPAALFTAIRAERDGREKLFGYYHSHPVGPPVPSEADVSQGTTDGRVWLIIGEGQIAAWQMTNATRFNSIDYRVDS